MKKKKGIIKRISNIVLTITLVILVLVVAVTVISRITGNTPSFFGYMVFRVSSGSMEPELKVGEVVLVKAVDDISTIDEGDIITYNGTEGNYKGKMITHEVVKAPYEENGQTYLLTKGVANIEEDPPILAEQVVGELVCKIPFVDVIYSFFLTPWGLILTILLIVLAFAGEFWSIYKLSHSQEDDPPQIDEETIQKAVEKYKEEKNKEIEAPLCDKEKDEIKE